jgi:hypothetical protein
MANRPMVLIMIINNQIFKINDTITSRELQLLFNLSSGASYRLLKYCETSGFVKPSTVKYSCNSKIVFWKILDREKFLVELQRRMT